MPKDMGNRITPSYVAFTNEERLVGDATQNQSAMNPTNTVFGPNFMIGLKFSDPVVHKDMQHLPFKVIRGDADRPQIEVQWKGETTHFCPEEILSMTLRNMKEVAETQLTEKVTAAVITFPAYFNDHRRQCMRDTAKIAGLDVQRMIKFYLKYVFFFFLF